MKAYFKPASICSNITISAVYLAKVNVLIHHFQANATYNSVLQMESGNFVEYIENPVNQVLLYSNCTAFVEGIIRAKLADKLAAKERQVIAQEIYERFRQIAHIVTNNQGLSELDSSEQTEHN